MANHVLITGGSRGIGAATAVCFAQQGWNVSINYFQSSASAQSLAAKLQGMGVQALALQADVSDAIQADEMVSQAYRQIGALDALVCCAGVALPQQLLTDTTNQQWKQVMQVDLDGVFYPVRACVPGFVRQKAGAIVTVSSMWGVSGGSCEAAYSAAKAGVIGLTKALAKELGPSNVRVNCVTPGVIDTHMNAHLSHDDLDALGEETPLGRIGTAQEVAQAIYFLASPQASFVTGQILGVDGGMVV